MNHQLSSILAGAATLALWQGTVQAISVNLVPSSENVSLGNTIDVAVIISDLGDGVAPSLSTYDLDISFDSTILDFSSAAFGDQLDLFGFGSLRDIEEPSIDVVSLFEVSFDSPDDLDNSQADSFILATLTFNTVAIGTSPLDLSIIDLGDALGDPLAADAGNSSVTVSQPAIIPEPSFTLLGFGLTIALISLSKRNS